MPELPEVETIRRGLEKLVVGHRIEDLTVSYPKIFQGEIKNVRGAMVKSIRRFAKVLVLDLSNNYSIVAQIKMTGQFIYRGPNLPNPPPISNKILGGLPGKHTHLSFSLDKGGVLYYNDVRKFGKLYTVKTDEVKNSGLIGRLGPEPFSDLTFERLKEILAKSKKPIKLLLLDQEKVSGVGNIYANEALWQAKIHPQRLAADLKEEEVKVLLKAIEEVLQKGIEYGGSSENTYVTAEGTEGRFQTQFKAYGQQGEPCSRCHRAKIEKINLGGRGTYYCPFCQK